MKRRRNIPYTNMSFGLTKRKMMCFYYSRPYLLQLWLHSPQSNKVASSSGMSRTTATPSVLMQNVRLFGKRKQNTTCSREDSTRLVELGSEVQANKWNVKKNSIINIFFSKWRNRYVWTVKPVCFRRIIESNISHSRCKHLCHYFSKPWNER